MKKAVTIQINFLSSLLLVNSPTGSRSTKYCVFYYLPPGITNLLEFLASRIVIKKQQSRIWKPNFWDFYFLLMVSHGSRNSSAFQAGFKFLTKVTHFKEWEKMLSELQMKQKLQWLSPNHRNHLKVWIIQYW